MTIVGCALGSAVAILVGLFGGETFWRWYFVTADDLIDSPLPPEQMIGLFVAGAAGLSVGCGLGLFQGIVIPFSIWSRLAWLAASAVSMMISFSLVYLLDIQYASVLEATLWAGSSGSLWFWGAQIALVLILAAAAYAVPTGVTLSWVLSGRPQPRPGDVAQRFD